ncbi:hypothetical protein L1987_74576 [Smallanthus sonchifolius]|uniref:Uncharacterized protein n=1 Tax=Smallanthus sonchifolius TaxID=185202 RepID=A0ACB9A4N1_9ASTR|nr:hypothetical protein L1987_74576 [Smallanthus sonchifolius]
MTSTSNISIIEDRRRGSFTRSKKAKYKDIQKMEIPKKPRFLCFHGHASNAARLEEQCSNWPDYVLEKMDLVFIDGPFTVEDGLYDWFTMVKNRYT